MSAPTEAPEAPEGTSLVDEPVNEPVNEPVKVSLGPTLQLYNLHGIRALIAEHYGRVINNLEMDQPSHIRDGSVISFTDPAHNVVIASCKCVMDSGITVISGGVTVIGVYFRDVTFGKMGRHPIKWT